MMLRRLAGSTQIASLKILVSVIEPVKEYRRARARPATMLTPLTRLIDAARPDARTGREFNTLVDGMIADAPWLSGNRERIAAFLGEWRDVRPVLDVIIDRSPILHEARQLPVDLAAIATAGLEALSYLALEVPPPNGWRDAKLALLEEARKPKAEVEFVIIEPITKLVVLAAERETLKSTPAAEWKDRVQRLMPERKPL
jgi:hexosaminidase